MWKPGGGGGETGGGKGRDAIVSDFCLCYKENGIQGIKMAIAGKGVNGKEALHAVYFWISNGVLVFEVLVFEVLIFEVFVFEVLVFETPSA